MIHVPDDAARILDQPLHAVLGTNRRSGPPQLSVVWYVWDGSAFLLSTTTDRAKYANIQRDPRVSLLVNDFRAARHVVAYGRAQITAEGHADLSRALFARYLPGTGPGDTATDPKRVVVRVSPERILTGS